eukprot:7426468-Pyramimonas_sp.AAC.1
MANKIGEMIHADRIQPPDDRPIVACGDGSGGKRSADRQRRRRGRARARPASIGSTDIFQIVGARCGQLPRRRQTSNNAELWVLLDCLRHTAGPLRYWTDSGLALKRWRNKQYMRDGEAGANGDLWAP